QLWDRDFDRAVPRLLLAQTVVIALRRAAGRGLTELGANDAVGIGGQKGVDDRLKQRTHQIRTRLGQASPSRPAGSTMCGAVIVMTPFEGSVRGSHEGSRGGRIYVFRTRR